MTDLALNEESYQRVLADLVPSAERFVWIATADLKDLHVAGAGRRMIPFVQVLGRLVEEGVVERGFGGVDFVEEVFEFREFAHERLERGDVARLCGADVEAVRWCIHVDRKQ